MKAMTQAELHEGLRQQLWIGVVTVVARAEAARTPETPIRYADAALAAFDRRFTPPREDTTGEKA